MENAKNILVFSTITLQGNLLTQRIKERYQDAGDSRTKKTEELQAIAS
ncbi:MAG TPA: hypothetical protein VK633_13590 [Verrucomicrobiae bacterium]|nr:hypothetical protein [Verrucomicrobiae bacterium]